MAITLDSISTGRDSASDLTVSHTTGAGTNRYLMALITRQDSNHDNLPVTTITYNGDSLTKLRSDEPTGNVRTEIWYLLNPDTGTNDAVLNGPSTIGECTMSIITVDGADQIAPEANNGTTGTSGSPSVSLTVATNNAWSFTICCSEGTYSSINNSQTLITGHPITDQSYENAMGGRKLIATAGAQTLGYSLSSGQPWAISAASIAEAAGESAVAPTVTTGAASVTSDTEATGNGNVTSDGGGTITERGFCWSISANPTTANDKTTVGGTTGSYSGSITGLIASTLYHYRAYATNSAGTGYGADTTFTTEDVPAGGVYTITINGTDRTSDVVANSLSIEDVINDKANTCTFNIVDLSGVGMPQTDDIIEIVLPSDEVLFGGQITAISLSKKTSGGMVAQVSCTDYTYLLDRNLAHISYENQTDAEIIGSLVNTYCPSLGITTTNVVSGVTISSIKFNYIQLSQVMRRICELTGRVWYIDYQKDIHYFPVTQNTAPFNIDDGTTTYSDLQITKDTTQLKNRVYVRGGTKLSDPTTYSVKGDGVARQFPLPDKPHDVTVTVNGTSKTVGIKNVNTSGYDWYLNFQEKYMAQDTGGTILTTGDTLAVTYTYDIPILVAVEDTDSIIANGVKEFAIFDKTIETTQAARDRATAELTDYANDVVEGTFITHTDGFRTGQYVNINLPDYGINDDYTVQKVTARAFGAGNFIYQVSIASNKTLGIIKFLIRLLESDKNLIELDDDEVVDELVSLSDLLISDSLTDALTIDSTGPYFTWCTSSADAAPITRARWELFQWG